MYVDIYSSLILAHGDYCSLYIYSDALFLLTYLLILHFFNFFLLSLEVGVGVEFHSDTLFFYLLTYSLFFDFFSLSLEVEVGVEFLIISRSDTLYLAG